MNIVKPDPCWQCRRRRREKTKIWNGRENNWTHGKGLTSLIKIQCVWPAQCWSGSVLDAICILTFSLFTYPCFLISSSSDRIISHQPRLNKTNDHFINKWNVNANMSNICRTCWVMITFMYRINSCIAGKSLTKHLLVMVT